MSTESTLQSRSDRESGSIGIGAMIVFIALILVAAVASTIIIKTAEELQQNAENTSSDTRQQISGKVAISDVYVTTTQESLDKDGSDDATGTATDVKSMTVIARVSSGSLNVQEGDVSWYISCILQFTTQDDAAETGETFAVVDTGTADSKELDGTDIATGTEITAGTTFRFTITLSESDTDDDDMVDDDDFITGAGGATAETPGCDAESGVGQELELRIVVDGGGETLATLKIQSLTVGSSIM